jgi:hypothetical protein
VNEVGLQVTMPAYPLPRHGSSSGAGQRCAGHRTMRAKHIDYWPGAKVMIGENVITFLANHKGKTTIAVVGPDAATAAVAADSPRPARRSSGRLIDKRPRVLAMDVRQNSLQNIASRAATA